MDIIISENDEIMKMIREIPIDNSMNVDERDFMSLVVEILKRRENEETEKI